jgi:hypothetical protein
VTTAWDGGEARQAGRGHTGCAASSMELIGRRPGEAPVAWRPLVAAPRPPSPSIGVAAAEGENYKGARVSSGGRGGFIG